MTYFIIFYTVLRLTSFPTYVVQEERIYVTCSEWKAQEFYKRALEGAEEVRIDTVRY